MRRMRDCLVLLTLTLTVASAVACVTFGDNRADAGADAAGSCGSQTCSATQICLYRECTERERCRPSQSCPAGTIPADCSGQPGCLVSPSQCAPILQGCRDIPPSCGGDITCAC